MPSPRHLRSIHPKISSMPRKQSEATTHLEIYKMSVEKNRLQQELETLKNREKQIIKRLTEIEEDTKALVSQVHSPQDSKTASPQKKHPAGPKASSPQSAFDFEEVYVEY